MSKAYIKKKLPDYVRLQRIRVLNGMDGGAEEDEASGAVKRPREDDMLRRVIFAFFIFHSKIPLSSAQNPFLKQYIKQLDPLTRLPHHLELNRIAEVAIDGVYLELSRIVKERREVVEKGFVSLATDFWTNSTKKKSFGVLMLDLIAEFYDFVDGQRLFMSRETAKNVGNLLLSVSVHSLAIYHHPHT